jgi:hypothetical protein
MKSESRKDEETFRRRRGEIEVNIEHAEMQESSTILMYQIGMVLLTGSFLISTIDQA